MAKKVVGLNICKHGFCWKYYLKLFKIYNYSSTLACLTLNIHLSGIIIFCYKKELQFWSNWFCFINQTAFNKFPNSCSVSNLTISISMKGTAQRKWKMKFSAHFLRFIHTHTHNMSESFSFWSCNLQHPHQQLGNPSSGNNFEFQMQLVLWHWNNFSRFCHLVDGWLLLALPLVLHLLLAHKCCIHGLKWENKLDFILQLKFKCFHCIIEEFVKQQQLLMQPRGEK